MADQEATSALEPHPPPPPVVDDETQQLPQHDAEPPCSFSPGCSRPLPDSSPFPPPNDDDDPWATKCVLSIDDGGGHGGYSSLVILQALMERVGEMERARNPRAESSVHSFALGPLDEEVCGARPASCCSTMTSESGAYWPCHYFDYVAGVGTGGVIAVMLGRYRMSVAEAMGKYKELCGVVVKRRLTSRQPKFARRDPVLLSSSSSSSSIRNKGSRRRAKGRTMQLVPAWPGPDEEADNLESDPERCRTIVCGCDMYLEPFRSYPGPEPRKHAVSDVIVRCLRGAPLPSLPSHGSEDSEARCCYYTNPSRTVLAEVSSILKRNSCGDEGTELVDLDGSFDRDVDSSREEEGEKEDDYD